MYLNRKSQVKTYPQVTMSAKTMDFLQKICYKKTASVDMTNYGFIMDSKVHPVALMMGPLRQKLEKICGIKSQRSIILKKRTKTLTGKKGIFWNPRSGKLIHSTEQKKGSKNNNFHVKKDVPKFKHVIKIKTPRNEGPKTSKNEGRKTSKDNGRRVSKNDGRRTPKDVPKSRIKSDLNQRRQCVSNKETTQIEKEKSHTPLIRLLKK